MHKMIPLLLLATACAPLTRFRQSAQIGHSAPAPWSGALAEAGEVWVGGGVEGGDSNNVQPSAQLIEVVNGLGPAKGSPGLFISPLRGFVQLRAGVSPGVELGLRGALDQRSLSKVSRNGVFDIPGAARSGRVGPTLGTATHVGKNWSFVGRADAMITYVPYARYQLVEGVDPQQTPTADDTEFYNLDETDVARRLLWTGSAVMSWRAPGRQGDAHVGVTLVDQLTNDGFSSSVQTPVERTTPALLIVAGGAVRMQNVRLGGQLWARAVSDLAYGSAMPSAGAQVLVEGMLSSGERGGARSTHAR